MTFKGFNIDILQISQIESNFTFEYRSLLLSNTIYIINKFKRDLINVQAFVRKV